MAGGACIVGHVRGGKCVWRGGACVAGGGEIVHGGVGVHGRGGCVARGCACRRDGHFSGRYASYWNAYLFSFLSVVSC